MKKIKHFIDISLEKFIVAINYADDLKGIKLEEISPLGDEIGKHYSNKPVLGLFKRRPTDLIQLGHLRFTDSNNKNYVNLGMDFLDFIFNEYDKWERELPKIIDVFSALINVTEVPDISKIVLTYIDKFEIPVDGFNYNDFFTFPIINNDEWDIIYENIFIGFVPHIDDFNEGEIKVVIRIRSRGIKDEKYIFGVETVGSFDNYNFSPNPEILTKILEECHARIEDIFIRFLTDEYRDDIGLETEDRE